MYITVMIRAGKLKRYETAELRKAKATARNWNNRRKGEDTKARVFQCGHRMRNIS